MKKTARSDSLSSRKMYVRTLQHGIKLESQISPCVFMYAGYPLQIEVTLKAQDGSPGGTAYAADDSLNAQTATEADIVLLLETVRVAPCKQCRSPAFDPLSVKTNRDGLCESCFHSKLEAEWAQEEEAELRRIAARDQQMKASGMKYRVTAWIHPDDGDDYQIDWYCPNKPTSADVKRRLRKLGSVILDDWQLISL